MGAFHLYNYSSIDFYIIQALSKIMEVCYEKIVGTAYNATDVNMLLDGLLTP